MPTPNCVDAPAPVNYTPDYAVYLAHRAEEREAERFTYADAIRARAIALAAATEAARYLETAPVAPDAHPAAAAEKRIQPTRLAVDRDAPTDRPAIAAKRVEFNREVETLDNRGSLIDILL